jgi:hypothetical protein
MSQDQMETEQSETEDVGTATLPTGDVERDEMTAEPTDVDASVTTQAAPSPGDQLRALPAEAQQRGTRFISAQAMQARLFSVYDAAAAAEEALDLVQQQLTLTLNRSYYEADEIETMAAQLDALLMLESIDLSESDLVSEE